jgi:hypothetical protein
MKIVAALAIEIRQTGNEMADACHHHGSVKEEISESWRQSAVRQP